MRLPSPYTPAELRAVLERVRARLATPERWTKDALARDAHGTEVGPRERRATCWCLTGAVWAEVPDADGRAAWAVCDALEDSLPSAMIEPRILERFNDAPHITHAHVLRVIDRAIHRTTKEQAVA